MPHLVVRLYPESGDLISKIRERESEVREIMGGVPGLVTYGLAETAGGAFSITVCEDQAGTDESTRRAAAWIKANMPDAQIAPPRVLEGEGVWVVQGQVDESQPHLVMRLFSQPPPDMVRQAEADVRGLLADVPGFRLCSVTDCGSSGMNLLVCDDKTGTTSA